MMVPQTPGFEMRYVHPEAFCTMVYKCRACGHEERVWNSRDGVTPFIIACERCGGEAWHYAWRAFDKREPDHVLVSGERIFIDVPEGVARAILWRREEALKGGPYEITDRERAKALVEKEAKVLVARREPLLVRVGEQVRVVGGMRFA